MDLFKVLSLNIMGLPIPFFVDHSRYKKIGEILGRRMADGTAPDCICIQEGFHPRVQELIQASQYPYVIEGPKQKMMRFSSGLWILSQHPIRTQIQHVFTKNLRWDHWVQKGMILAEVETPRRKSTIQLINLHLASDDANINLWTSKNQGQEIRSFQIRETIDHVKKLTNKEVPFLISGDFNLRPNYPEAQALFHELNLQCAAHEQHPDFHQSDDHHFYRGLKPVHYERRFTADLDGQLSDHSGLEVHYQFEK